MKKDYTMYSYYKGEKQNPFNPVTENSKFMFWGYELHFEELYNSGRSPNRNWDHISNGQEEELKKVLANKPVNKEELFKLWLYYLLSDYLPSKGGYSYDTLRNLYFNS